MKRATSGLIAAALLLGHVFPCAVAAVPAPAPEAAPAAVTSAKDRGVVSVQPDAALTNGQLALKVVAFNRGNEPASFGPDNVEVYTAAGKRVDLVSLEQLVKEVTASAPSNGRGRVEHDPSSYSGAGVNRNSAGQPDVGNYTG
jgi:hypothetical protein